MNRHEFLSLILPRNKVYVSASLKNKSMVHTTHTSVASIALWDAPIGCNAYFAPAGFHSSEFINKGKVSVRCQENVGEVQALWADFDPTQSVTQDMILLTLRHFSIQPSIIVDSGRGVQVFWLLSQPINVHQWRTYADGLRAMLLDAAEPIYGADTSQWCNPAALMRMVGTVNIKTGREAVVIGGTMQPLTDEQLGAILCAADTVKAAAASGSEGVFDDDQKVAYHELLSRCQLLYSMAKNPNDVPEPAWYAALGCLRGVHDGEEAAVEFSKGHKGFDEAETRMKYRQWRASATGFARCSTLRAHAPLLAAPACLNCTQKDYDHSPLRGVRRSSVKPSINVQDALNVAYDSKAAFTNLPVVTLDLGQNAAPKVIPWAREEPTVYERACNAIAAGGKYVVVNNAAGVPCVCARATSRDTEPATVIEGAIPYFEAVQRDALNAKSERMYRVRWFFDSTRSKVFAGKVSHLQSNSAFVPHYAGAIPGVAIVTPTQAVVLMSSLIREATAREEADKLPMVYYASQAGWTHNTKKSEELSDFISPNGMALLSGKPAKVEMTTADGHALEQKYFDVTSQEAIDKAHALWVEANAPWGATVSGSIAFAAAFASPLLKLLNLDPITYHLQGAAGSFKTSAVVSALSAFYYDDQLKAATASLTALQGDANAFGDVMWGIDEVTNMDIDDLVSLIATHSGRKGKSRRGKSGDYALVATEVWHNLLVTTSNNSITDVMVNSGTKRRSNNNTIKRKYLEILVPSHSKSYTGLIDVAINCATVNAQTAGAAGIKFLQSVLTDVPKFRQLFEHYKSVIDATLVDVSSVVSLQKHNISLLLAAAEWCTRFNIFPFDLVKLKEVLVDNMNTQVDAYSLRSADQAMMPSNLLSSINAYMQTEGQLRVADVQLEYSDHTGGIAQIHVNHYAPERASVPPLVLVVYPLTPLGVQPSEPEYVLISEMFLRTKLAKAIGFNASEFTTESAALVVASGISTPPTVTLNVSNITLRTDPNTSNPMSKYIVPHSPTTFHGSQWVAVPCIPRTVKRGSK